MLGLAWDYEADVISFDLTEIAERAEGLPATKRNTLRLLAGIFDPLGIMGPVTVKVTCKIMFQDVCRQKSGWDDPLQGDGKQGVESWIKSLIDCQTIMIHRCVARRSTALFTPWLRGRQQDSLLCGYLPGIHNQYWKIHENVDFEDGSRPIERVVDTEARAHVGADAGEAYE